MRERRTDKNPDCLTGESHVGGENRVSANLVSSVEPGDVGADDIEVAIGPRRTFFEAHRSSPPVLLTTARAARRMF